MDPYLTNAEELLREGKARLESLSVRMRSPAPAFSALSRRRKLMNFEARYAEVTRRFEMLRTAGTEGGSEPQGRTGEGLGHVPIRDRMEAMTSVPN